MPTVLCAFRLDKDLVDRADKRVKAPAIKDRTQLVSIALSEYLDRLDKEEAKPRKR